MSMKGIGRSNRAVALLVSCLFLIVGSGCGSKNAYDVTTMEFTKDGKIIEHIVEEFDTAIYDSEELKQTIESEIAEYTKASKSAVSLLEFGCEGDIVRCTVEYPSDDAYFDINNVPLFYGTISQAIRAGYNIAGVHEISSGDEINNAKLEAMKESHIVIVNQAVDVNTYKDISYVSDGVVIGDDHKKATVSGETTAYIVFD